MLATFDKAERNNCMMWMYRDDCAGKKQNCSRGDESTALGLMEQQQQPVESATDRFQPRVALHPARLGKKLVVCVKVYIWLY